MFDEEFIGQVANALPLPAHRFLEHHDPVRPAWVCDTCAEPWPCETKRAEMMKCWSAVPRGLTMAAYFCQAIEDLGMLEGLYLRFMGWVRG